MRTGSEAPSDIGASRIVISVDAMGGDAGPAVVVAGLVLSAAALPNVDFILHGDEAVLTPLLARHDSLKGRVILRHAPRVVLMTDKPSQVMRQHINLQSIAMDQIQPPRMGRRNLGQCGHAARVLLDRQHMPRAFRKQPPRQTARPRPHLQHITSRQIPRRAGNLGGQVQIEQKVLAHSLFGHQIMRPDHLAQGRQPVNRSQTRSPFILAQIFPGSGAAPQPLPLSLIHI